MSITIGIDFGSTNTTAAYVPPGAAAPVSVDIENGARLLPSVVTIRGGSWFVGQAAINEGQKADAIQFDNFKRNLGVKWNAEENRGANTVATEGDMLAYEGPEGECYLPEAIAQLVISRAIDAVQARMPNKERPKRAVITLPADSSQAARQATIQAGKDAGLEEVFLMHEPTAAAVAHGLLKLKRTESPAIFDLGGGTFDVTIMMAGKGVIDVISTNGNRFLGGADLTRRLVQYIVSRFHDRHGIDLALRERTMRRIWDEAERVKKGLSEHEVEHFHVPRVETSDTGILHVDEEITRETFEGLVEDLIDETLACFQRALDDAHLRKEDISRIFLVGGQTAMPLVQRKVAEFIGKEPSTEINPYEVVALGAAIQGAILDNRISARIEDVGAHAIGVETLGDMIHVISDRNSEIGSEAEITLTNEDDDQARISINVFEGNRFYASECEALVRAFIEIPPAKARTAKVRVRVKRQPGDLVCVYADDQIIYGAEIAA